MRAMLRTFAMGLGALAAVTNATIAADELSPAITSIIEAPKYAGATWGIRALDLATGDTIVSYGPDTLFFTGSVRKLFSVGTLLNAIGTDHTFETPVYRTGAVSEGTLNGDLILVASGDITLGGRTLPGGTVAYTSFDHTEANSLGTAILTDTDPLAGLNALAQQVADSGITRVEGDVVIDDRLFEHFRVPNGNVLITPIAVNENLVDVTITPGREGEDAIVTSRPETAAFTVTSEVTTSAAGTESTVTLEVSPDDPTVGIVKGQIPADYKPTLPGATTLVQTFTPPDPSAFARTLFIEALSRAGVTVTAAAVGENPSAKLPAPGSYHADDRVALFTSPPYGEYSTLILKVSLNFGANMSLALLGVQNGAAKLPDMLAAERKILVEEYGLPDAGFDFPTNGSGSPDSRATPEAVTMLLAKMQETPGAKVYFDALPAMGVDGSLQSIGVDPPNAIIAPGIGKVYAKTGTTMNQDGLKAQVFAGYINAKSGRTLAYVVYVNDVTTIRSIADVIGVFSDEGEISAVLYGEN